MKKNSVQFSVVREDPQIEMRLVQDFDLNQAVLIGSGGCTAFCLKAMNPALKITLIEPNPAQIELIKEKIRLFQIEKRRPALLKKFGVGVSSPGCLIERGNFESLFRQLRLFIQEFLISEGEMVKALKGNSSEIWKEVFLHPYWQVAFELFFSDSILKAMFGQSAIQHAPPGSYPRYFQNVLEKGLLRDDISENYFLHHIFLGRYEDDAGQLPFYLKNLPENLEFDFFAGAAQNYMSFKGKQLAHFSNIFDWSDEIVVRQIAGFTSENLAQGSIVVYRQLNNKKNFRLLFGKKFKWLDTSEIVDKDRSLFYEKIEIGEKI